MKNIEITPLDHVQQPPKSLVVRSLLTNAVAHRKVKQYLAATHAKNTQKAYQKDIEHFLQCGGKIPATPACVASYLAEHATTLSIATLNRRIVAIGWAHAVRGYDSPTKSALVVATLRGIRRTNGSAQRQAAPLVKQDIAKVVQHLTGIKGMRDKALLLIGFAGAFRRSELVALQVEDVRFVCEGIIIHLRRSKTDQNGQGRKIAIPYVRAKHCPVRALKTWLTKSGIQSGALFRRINRYQQIMDQGLTAQSVSLIIKQRVTAAGLDAATYSGHSLRAGFVTSAAQKGVQSWKIRQQTDHKSDQMLQRYIRDSRLFTDHTVKKIW